MSIKDAIAFRELQQQVAVLAAQMEQLVAEHATEKGRLTALEEATAAECDKRVERIWRREGLKARPAAQARTPVTE